MAKYKKYVIVENRKTGECEIRFGFVEFHMHLENKSDRQNWKQIIGGGMWSVNHENKSIKLFGRSTDFGKAPSDKIQKAIENFNDWMHLNMIIKMVDMPEICPLDTQYSITEDIYS